MAGGSDAARSVEEAEPYEAQRAAIGAQRVVAIDASATFSRPGPRLVDGLETIAHILHPRAVPEAPGPALEVDLR